MKAKWICYPHDFEMYLFNKFMEKRYERNVLIPPFWRLDSYYRTVKFSKTVELKNDVIVNVKVSRGTIFNISDGMNGYIYDIKNSFTLTKGKHDLLVTLYNVDNLPTILLECDEFVSDDSWITTCNDHVFKKASTLKCAPEDFKLQIKKIDYKNKEYVENKVLYDLGKENMVFIKIKNATHPVRVYLGESRLEALDFDCSETLCDFTKANEKTKFAKACRYIALNKEDDFELEFFEENVKHAFCPTAYFEDKELNDIYNVSLYTLHLNTREFFIDGIKRDRWVWAGDAYQSNLMTYYSFNDFDILKRTMIALLGKKPYMTHINHIMDYSLFFIRGVYEYLLYSGDFEFIKENFDDLKEFMDFVISRADKDGLLTGLEHDWVFIDWSDLDNRGQVCAEQILYYVALDSMYKIGKALKKENEVNKYKELSLDVFNKIELFFNDKKNYYEHNRLDGKFVSEVRKHSNIFAILFDICDENRKEKLMQNVLCNNKVLKITTPYMRFYELAALAKQHKFDYVMNEFKNYWGGMLNKGATSFWEKYDSNENEPECYSMYNRKYGKSLCHAWGANPIYLIGRYLFGLEPTSIGYKTFKIEPQLDYLKNFEITYPINKGKIFISHYDGVLKIKFNYGKGILKINNKEIALEKNKENIINVKEAI